MTRLRSARDTRRERSRGGRGARTAGPDRHRRMRRRTRTLAEETSARLEALRNTARDAPSDEVIVGRFRFRAPEALWAGAFSVRHPRVRVEYLNRGEITLDVSVSDCWIGGGPPGVWAPEISRFPDVVKVESLSEMGTGSLYRVTFRNPPIIDFLRSLRVPLQFPVWFQSGFGGIEVVIHRSEFEAFKRFARSVDPAVHVESIRRGPLRSHLPLLTSAQRTILLDALSSGYFAVPRRVTLTELARRVNRSRSALSRTIAVIERKLLESALTPVTIRP